jgi:hypothetical protein
VFAYGKHRDSGAGRRFGDYGCGVIVCVSLLVTLTTRSHVRENEDASALSPS